MSDIPASLYRKGLARCFNCAEGLRAERLARRLKGGGLAGEVLPAGDDQVAIFGVEFHHAAVAGGLFAGDQG